MATNANNDMTYKGYTGSTEISFEDSCLHGSILFIEDLITYEGSTVEELIVSFHEAVDRYISYCEENGQTPNAPFSGTFNVRTGRELHRKAAMKAREHGCSLNEFVIRAISDRVVGTSLEAVNSTFEFIESNTKPNKDPEPVVLWSTN